VTPPPHLTPRAEPPKPVTITVSPLEWRTLPFGGAPTLLAVRQVQTPDGTLAQGFIVDRSRLTSLLAARAGALVAELRTGTDGQEIVPGLALVVAPNPSMLATSADEATQLTSTFIRRLAMVGAMAALVALLVLVLVARAEQLARERSQFAASAAH